MSSGIQVSRVQNAPALREFLEFPYALYAGDPNWVAPLRSAQKKMFSGRTAFHRQARMTLLLGRDGAGSVLARVAAIENLAHNRHYGDHTGFIGFFECVPERPEAGLAVLEQACAFLAEKGYDRVRGPMNPSMNAECGLLIHGYGSPPAALMPYNPPEYPVIFEEAGFEKCKDLFAYLVTSERMHPGARDYDRLMRLAARVRRRHPEITTHILDKKRIEEQILRYIPVFEEARRDNWGYVPVSEEEIVEMARDMKAVVDPRIICFAEVHGVPAGVGLALPDFHEALRGLNGRLFPFGLFRFLVRLRRVRNIRVFGVAALERYRNLGITTVVLAEIISRAQAAGYRDAEASWVLEDNLRSNRVIRQALNPVHYKTYRIYEKEVGR